VNRSDAVFCAEVGAIPDTLAEGNELAYFLQRRLDTRGSSSIYQDLRALLRESCCYGKADSLQWNR